MGAGAGYNVTVHDADCVRFAKVIPQDLKSLNRWNDGLIDGVNVVVKCDVDLDATISCESYYNYSGKIDTKIIVTEVSVDLRLGEGYNSEILTKEAIAYYEEKYDSDIENLWKEIVSELTVEQVELSYIEDIITNGSNYIGESDTIGAGWSHVTFDGVFTVSDVDSRSGYNDIDWYEAFIPEDNIVKFIDSAITGDNVDYCVVFDSEFMDDYKSESEAIEALKNLIDAAIKDGTIYDIDLSECYVQEEIIYFDDADLGDVVYSADEDEYFEEYV